MAEVKLSINGKEYGVACDDGQEQRVAALGNFVDERFREIAGAGAAASEAHLFVLTSLVLADEIFDLREHLNAAAQSGSGAGYDRVSPQEEELIVQAIDSLATRIERIAGRISSA